MKSLVTGAAGFIGSHLVEALLELGFPVIGVDNLSTGKLDNIKDFALKRDFQFIKGDLRDEGIRQKAMDGVEAVFHLAAIPSVPKSVRDPLATHSNGADLTMKLLEEAMRRKINRFVYSSSCAVYGNPESLPLNERLLPKPLCPYAADKLSGEHQLAAFYHCYGMETVSLRYFNVYGPRQDFSSPYSGAIAKFCTQVLLNEPATINGDGKQTRDFVYVKDVVRANITAATCGPGLLQGDAINIGTGKACDVNSLLDLVYRVRRSTPLPPVFKPFSKGDVLHSVADINRAKEVIGYVPRYELSEGIADTFAWYASNTL